MRLTLIFSTQLKKRQNPPKIFTNTIILPSFVTNYVFGMKGIFINTKISWQILQNTRQEKGVLMDSINVDTLLTL